MADNADELMASLISNTIHKETIEQCDESEVEP